MLNELVSLFFCYYGKIHAVYMWQMTVSVTTTRKIPTPVVNKTPFFLFLFLNAAYALAPLALISRIYLTWDVAGWIRTDVTVVCVCMKIFIYEPVELKNTLLVYCAITQMGSVCPCQNYEYVIHALKGLGASFVPTLYCSWPSWISAFWLPVILSVGALPLLLLSKRSDHDCSRLFFYNKCVFLYLLCCLHIFFHLFYMDLSTYTTVAF